MPLNMVMDRVERCSESSKRPQPQVGVNSRGRHSHSNVPQSAVIGTPPASHKKANELFRRTRIRARRPISQTRTWQRNVAPTVGNCTLGRAPEAADCSSWVWIKPGGSRSIGKGSTSHRDQTNEPFPAVLCSRYLLRRSFGLPFLRSECCLLARHHRANKHRYSRVADHQRAPAEPMPVDTGERWLLGPTVRLLSQHWPIAQFRT